MKLSHSFFVLLCLLFFAQIKAQVIPDSLRVDWWQAGFAGSIPNPSLIINVKDFGAVGDGVHNDYKAIMNAMNSSSLLHVVYFPAGNYLIRSSIAPISNTIFRGEGANTNLIFDIAATNKKDAFNITSQQTSVFTNIDSGYNKGSTTLKLNNITGFNKDSFAEIREMNGDWNTVPATWATYCVGQIVKIKAIHGNKLIIEPALRIDFTSNLNPQIRPVSLKTNIGIECLKITRADTIVNGSYGYNIRFSYAANCWVAGIESNKSQASHIVLESSKNISISGSYFHDAFTYDGTATAGYGITMIQHNSDCRAENNIFKHLRHPMVAKQGANGNVFAYNYSTDPYRSEYPHDAGGDMVLHGHYPFANLFEGNIGESIIVDDTWGAAGPYNTFFRNRAELYGIIIFDDSVNTRKQNVVGNEVTNTDSFKGNYYLQPAYHFTYDNNINNIIQPPVTNNLPDTSYYLTSKPYFWNISSAWPSIGGSNILNSGSNPARDRYFSGGDKTVCLKPNAALNIVVSIKSIKCNNDSAKIIINATGGQQPYSGTGIYYKPAGNYVFFVSDALNDSAGMPVNIQEPLPVTFSTNSLPAQTCNPNGIINITNVTGGNKPYLFSLNNIDYVTDSIFKNLFSGTYTIFIKDNAGCIRADSNVIISSIPSINISAKPTRASNCMDDGTIKIKKVSGGIAPFKYSIDNRNYITGNTFYNLASGNYTARIKDKTGCVDSLQNVIVLRADTLKISLKKINTSCKNASDGAITIKATGGTKPYSYSIDSINYSTNNLFANLKAGNYTCRVKDVKGCIAFYNTSVRNGKENCSTVMASLNNNSKNELSVSIFPNPTTREFTIAANDSNQQPIQFIIADAYGRIIQTINGYTNTPYRIGDKLSAGVYILKINKGKLFKAYKLVKQ